MSDVIEGLCRQMGVTDLPEDGLPALLTVQGKQVAVYQVPDQKRHFVYCEVAVGQLDKAGLTQLGRIGLSWAAGSALSLGLHPELDDVVVLGQGLDNLTDSPQDLKRLSLCLQNVVSASNELQRLLGVSAPPRRPGQTTASRPAPEKTTV